MYPQLVTQPRSSSCIHFIHVGRKRAPVAALEIRVLFSIDIPCCGGSVGPSRGCNAFMALATMGRGSSQVHASRATCEQGEPRTESEAEGFMLATGALMKLVWMRRLNAHIGHDCHSSRALPR